MRPGMIPVLLLCPVMAEGSFRYLEHLLDSRGRQSDRYSYNHGGPFLSRNDHSDFHMYPRTANDISHFFPSPTNFRPPTSTTPPVPTPTLPPIIQVGTEDIGEECGICREEFKEGESVQPVNCGQKLHAHCMDRLMEHNRGNFRCPFCRSC